MKLQLNLNQSKILLLALFFFFATSIPAFAQSFITTWKTDNFGISDSTSITIPTTGSGYNYDIDWDNAIELVGSGFLQNLDINNP